MSYSHREETRGDRLLDILTDEDTGIRLVVSRLGAELISLARRNANGDWIGFLYRDNDVSQPESGWANHSTVMGYFLHRLKDGRSLYRGRYIEGGTHSFLRVKNWHFAKEMSGDGQLTYCISRADYTETEYPLNVSLDLRYQLSGEDVRVSFDFQSHEVTQIAHLEFGLHPGFGAQSVDSFRLHMPAGRYRRYCAPENYLAEETEDFSFACGEMPFAREKLRGSYILEFIDVPNRTFVYEDAATGRSVTLDFTGVPYVTLWSDGGPFLCVEPCWGLTDHHKQRTFEEKAGIQKIEPGGRLVASFGMRPRLITNTLAG